MSRKAARQDPAAIITLQPSRGKTLAKRKHRKPTDPAEIARRAYEARRNPAMWGTNDAALNLPQNNDVRQEAETRAKTRRVFRYDCFATLKLPGASLAAVRRLQEDLATRFRVGDASGRTEFIDGKGAVELVTSRSVDAGKRVDRVLALIEPWQSGLLLALSTPAIVKGEAVNWKNVVRQRLGVIDRNIQAHKVREAAEALRSAYAAIDSGLQKAA